jgi:HEAT repeat protein
MTRRSFVIGALLVSSAFALVAAQGTRRSFDALGRDEKVALLYGLFPKNSPQSAPVAITSETVENLISALSDPESEIRDIAARVVSGHADRARFDAIAGTNRFQKLEKPGRFNVLVDRLYETFASDPDLEVRLHSLVALGALEFQPGGSPLTYALSPRLVQALNRQYALDSSSRVRTEIVQALGLSQTPLSQVRETLLASLDDVSPGVVRVAVTSAGQRKLAEGLPKLISLLSNEDPTVRQEVAKAFVQFGASALPYLPALRNALTNETNEDVRSSLSKSIDVLSRIKG